MNVYEMEGFLRGECLPGDLKVNESNAEYLVRKLNAVGELKGELTAALETIEKCREIVGCPDGIDLQDHLQQLAAENVALKAAITDHSQSVHFCEVCGKDDPCSTDDVCYALKDIPATDRIYAGIKADGVEEFAAKLRIPSDDQFFDALAKGVALAADDFAKQMREGADK